MAMTLEEIRRAGLEALRQRGFSILLTQALMVKELALRVPMREKALMPSFG